MAVTHRAGTCFNEPHPPQSAVALVSTLVTTHGLMSISIASMVGKGCIAGHGRASSRSRARVRVIQGVRLGPCHRAGLAVATGGSSCAPKSRDWATTHSRAPATRAQLPASSARAVLASNHRSKRASRSPSSKVSARDCARNGSHAGMGCDDQVKMLLAEFSACILCSIHCIKGQGHDVLRRIVTAGWW
jgi:hypothetical protein